MCKKMRLYFSMRVFTPSHPSDPSCMPACMQSRIVRTHVPSVQPNPVTTRPIPPTTGGPPPPRPLHHRAPDPPRPNHHHHQQQQQHKRRRPPLLPFLHLPDPQPRLTQEDHRRPTPPVPLPPPPPPPQQQQRRPTTPSSSHRHRRRRLLSLSLRLSSRRTTVLHNRHHRTASSGEGGEGDRLAGARYVRALGSDGVRGGGLAGLVRRGCVGGRMNR